MGPPKSVPTRGTALPARLRVVPNDRERARELRSVLLQAAQAAATYLDAPVWEPSPGSQGAAEVANEEVGPSGPWGQDPVRTAHALPPPLIDSAVTRVRALALLTRT